jgi:Ca-activated chloride channel family protein
MFMSSPVPPAPPPPQLTLPFARTYNQFAVHKPFTNGCLATAALVCLASAANAQAPAPTPAAPPSPQSQTKITTVTSLVHLVAVVTDRHHKFITNLEQKDFRILEDGQSQDITFFNRESDLPLRIGMLLDTSNSIRERLRFEQDAAVDFLNDTLRRNKDMAFLMTFDNEPEVIQDFTGDLSLLTTAIQKQRAGGGTALRDAIFQASQKLITAPLPAGVDVRRVLVVISDGDDNLSDHTRSDAIEMVQRAEASIYAISTNTDWLALEGDKPHKMHETPGDHVLEQFANDTGGRVFFPYRIDDLAQSFQDIGNELRSQYLIAYHPARPGSNGEYRAIRVEVDRNGLVVRTRKGYFAAAPSAGAKPSGQ